MRAVATAWHTGDRNERTKGSVIQRVPCEKVLVLIVASRSPGVADLLEADLRID
jgi:hypothetical protein